MGREGVEPPNGVAELIYSQRPLATWIPVRVVRAVCSTRLEPTTRVELVTYRLQIGCATVALLGRLKPRHQKEVYHRRLGLSNKTSLSLRVHPDRSREAKQSGKGGSRLQSLRGVPILFASSRDDVAIRVPETDFLSPRGREVE